MLGCSTDSGRRHEASSHSAGISNTSIRDTLVDLLGKPIAESNALCIPTAAYTSPRGASMAYQLIHGVADTPLCEVGWKSLGVLELTALPSIEKEHWTAAVQQTDALLAGGGDPLYLRYWMRQSGLADLLPSLRETVYVGVSAGSTVMALTSGKASSEGCCPRMTKRWEWSIARCFRTSMTRICPANP
jgi:dipeptidase E